MRQNRVHLMPPMSNFYARICVKATPSSNICLPDVYHHPIFVLRFDAFCTQSAANYYPYRQTRAAPFAAPSSYPESKIELHKYTSSNSA